MSHGSSEDGEDEGSVLPLYGVQGWPSEHGYVVVSGMTSLNDDGHEWTLSVSGRQVAGERMVEVTSYRRGRSTVEELRSRTVEQLQALGTITPLPGGPVDNWRQRLSSTAEVDWSPLAIRVDDVPTDFAVGSLEDGWAAVGEGPSSTIAIAARRVTPGEISLVRLPDPYYDTAVPAGRDYHPHGRSRPKR
jgi:hypothetical protein